MRLKNLHPVLNKQGFAALFTVVIVGAAALLMAYSALLLGLGDLEMGYDTLKGGEASSIASGCIEEGLRRLRLDASYAGDLLSIGDGSCILSITSLGNTRTIVVTSTIQNHNKHLEVNLTLVNGIITMNEWKEN